MQRLTPLPKDNSRIAHLTTHLSIHWGAIEDGIIDVRTEIGFEHKQARIRFITLKPDKLGFILLARSYDNSPSRPPSSFALFLHEFRKPFLIYDKSTLTSHQFSKIEWKTVGVVELKGEIATDYSLNMAIRSYASKSNTNHTDPLVRKLHRERCVRQRHKRTRYGCGNGFQVFNAFLKNLHSSEEGL